jgi:hypothetical protein
MNLERIVVLIAAGLVLVGAIVIAVEDELQDATAAFGVFLVLLVAAFFGDKLPLEGTWPQSAATVLAVLPILSFVATLIVLDDGNGSKDFHSTAAEIIPVLLLAIAIEAKGFGRRQLRTGTQLGAALSTMLLLAYGGGEALQSLWKNQAHDGDIVGAALVAGFVGVLVVWWLGEEAARRADGDGEGEAAR